MGRKWVSEFGWDSLICNQVIIPPPNPVHPYWHARVHYGFVGKLPCSSSTQGRWKMDFVLFLFEIFRSFDTKQWWYWWIQGAGDKLFSWKAIIRARSNYQMIFEILKVNSGLPCWEWSPNASPAGTKLSRVHCPCPSGYVIIPMKGKKFMKKQATHPTRVNRP